VPDAIWYNVLEVETAVIKVINGAF